MRAWAQRGPAEFLIGGDDLREPAVIVNLDRREANAVPSGHSALARGYWDELASDEATAERIAQAMAMAAPVLQAGAMP